MGDKRLIDDKHSLLSRLKQLTDKLPLVGIFLSTSVLLIFTVFLAYQSNETVHRQLLIQSGKKLEAHLIEAYNSSLNIAHSYKQLFIDKHELNNGTDVLKQETFLQSKINDTLLNHPDIYSITLLEQHHLSTYSTYSGSRDNLLVEFSQEHVFKWFNETNTIKAGSAKFLNETINIEGLQHHLIIHNISTNSAPLLIAILYSPEFVKELTTDSIFSQYRLLLLNQSWGIFIDNDSSESGASTEQLAEIISTLKQRDHNDESLVLDGIGNLVQYQRIQGLNTPVLFRLFIIKTYDDLHLVFLNNQLTWIVFVIALASIIIVISLITNRRSLSPLTKIAREIQRYQQSNEVYKLPVNASGEIGELSRSFSQLIDEIENRSKIQEQAIDKASSASLRLQAVLTSMVDAVININEQGNILAFNHSAEKMFGYHANEVLGKNVSLLMPLNIAQNHDNYLANYSKTGKQNIIQTGRELPAIRKDGSTFPMYLSVSEIETKEGKLFTGLIRDTSDKKMLEAERNRVFESSKELAWRLDFALSAPRIGVWEYDAQTKVVSWDKRMFRLYGEEIDNGKMPAEIWQKAIHPEDKRLIESAIEKSLLTGLDFKQVFRIILPNMIVNHIESHAKAIYDEKGDITGLVGTNRDVTEEQLLHELKQQALDMAEDSLKLKSEFLASMSHEIRTPMNGVLGMLGLLKQTDLKDRQLHYVELASSSANSLLTLINDILDFSKIEAGKLELEILDFDLRGQLGEVAESLALKAQEKGIEIILDVNSVNTSMIQSDPTRIRQIVSNLLSNAIKFTEQGEIVIRARLEEGQTEHQKLICSVSDSGIGIPAHKVASLFESFTQVDASTTRQYGGTGLGLAIVKQLCVLMGGDIKVTSEVDVGSTFEFYVDVKLSGNEAIMMPTVAIEGAKVLIVDDNTTNIEVLETQLKQWEAIVSIAYNGKEALDCVESHEKNYFDVAILDMQMPNMNGAELGMLLKKSTLCQNTKLIMMTSMGTTGDAQYFSDLGFSAYFPKPTTTSDLFDALTVVLDDSEALSSATPLVTHQHLQTLIKPQEPGNVPSKMHILLVEDNRINQAVVNGMLEAWGVQADIANNGVEALDILKSTDKYEIILMDCQMPKMDGYQTTKQIRSGTQPRINREIPIVAMTANAMKGDKEKCLAAGMSDYISKPVCAEILQEKLEQWCRKLPNKVNAIVVGNTEAFVPSDNESQELAEQDLIVWDKQGLLSRVSQNQALANKLTSMFLDDAPESIKILLRAINTKNYDELTAISHKIKGSVRNIGGVKLGALAHEMELASKQANALKVNELKYSFEEAFHEFSLELKGSVKTNDSKTG